MSKVERSSGVADARQRAVADTIRRIREIGEAEGITPASLDKFKAELMKLTNKPELFPVEDFPHPTGTENHTRYLVHEEPDDKFVLYLNSMKPGKSASPHDHADTWAVVVALHGEEENQLWNVTMEDRVAMTAKLQPDRLVTVKPGTGIAVMPRQVHSIAIKGTDPTMHLHLYGQPLEQLGVRRGYDLVSGKIFEFKSHGQTVGKG